MVLRSFGLVGLLLLAASPRAGAYELGAPYFLPYAAGPGRITFGDFNGDGRTDFARSDPMGFPDPRPDYLTVYLQTPAGTLVALPTLSLPNNGFGGMPLRVADMDNDGDDDLVIGASVGLQILRYDGASGFTSASSASSPILDLAVFDFNGDGKRDIIVKANSGADIVIHLGDGAGGVASKTTFANLGPSIEVLRGADMDGDGSVELVANNLGAQVGTISVRKYNGAGGFQAPTIVTMDLNSFPLAFSLGDVNGDGRMDIVQAGVEGFGSFASAFASIKFQTATGGFAAPARIPLGRTTASFAGTSLADLNGDGKTDLLVLTNSPTYLLQASTGFSRPTARPDLTDPGSIMDFNRDGCGDLVSVTVQFGQPAVRVIPGQRCGDVADFAVTGKLQSDLATVSVGNTPASNVATASALQVAFDTRYVTVGIDESALPPTCALTGVTATTKTVECALASLVPGESRVLSIPFLTKQGALGAVKATATVLPVMDDLQVGNNTQALSVFISPRQLQGDVAASAAIKPLPAIAAPPQKPALAPVRKPMISPVDVRRGSARRQPPLK